jgi:cellulose synthase/poly-beta-1,6-N-acetylglucosamine synthase-like glycosyltransferase/phosphatidylglycerophosphate synthase
VVIFFAPNSFLGPSVDTLYTYYGTFGFWPFDADVLVTSLTSGALFNLEFIGIFLLTTLVCIVIFWHPFYFLYIFLASFGQGKTLSDYTPTVSILMPALDEEAFIGETLDKILDSDYPMDKLEVIVIASGSTDRTAEVAMERASKGPVKVLTEALTKRGKPAALQLGLSHAKHEVVAIIDAETHLEPQALKELVRPLQQEDVVAVQGTVQVSNVDEHKLCKGQAMENAIYNGGGLYHEIAQKREVRFLLMGRNYCVRRELLVKLGGYTGDSLTEDIKMTFDIALEKGRIVFAPKARAWERVIYDWDVMKKQRLRWTAGWNIENKRYIEMVEDKKDVFLPLFDFIIGTNFIAFYPVVGPIVGLLFLLIGELVISASFFILAITTLLIQAVAARRYADRIGLVTGFFTFFRLYWWMFRNAMKPTEIPEEWEKTEKDASTSDETMTKDEPEEEAPEPMATSEKYIESWAKEHHAEHTINEKNSFFYKWLSLGYKGGSFLSRHGLNANQVSYLAIFTSFLSAFFIILAGLVLAPVTPSLLVTPQFVLPDALMPPNGFLVGDGYDLFSTEILYGALLLILAFALWLLSGFLDALDGAVARLTYTQSNWGSYFEQVLDKYADAVVVIALIMARFIDLFWGLWALVGFMMVDYARARHQADGVAPVKVTPGERPFRIILLSTAAGGQVLAYLAITFNVVILISPGFYVHMLVMEAIRYFAFAIMIICHISVYLQSKHVKKMMKMMPPGGAPIMEMPKENAQE